jgi:hypothetical protein
MQAPDKPEYIVNLEAAYGLPGQAGFGSAVFFERVESAGALEREALKKYEYFVGDSWKRAGKDAWMAQWKKVYVRQANDKHDIVGELRSLTDQNARLSAPMILDGISNADAARLALSGAYDDASVVELTVYNIGDGEAMSGLLIAARRSDGEGTFLVFLMD